MGDSLAVSTHRLGKKFGTESVAVVDLDLRVPNGQVYGFLGRNGAGKTTTMRMLVGLVHPTSGSAEVLGGNPGSPDVLAKIGALIEAPAFYPQMSGRDNLRLLARYAGIPETPVDEVLRLVGLGDRGRHRYRTYSLGMKQRLGVAATLLKNPELLILDEPTNGLDPAGMAEIRTLIRTLARDGRTVLLSSHLLGEVEQVCDRIGVIHEGRLLADGTINELRARSGRAGLVVRADPVQAAVTCLDTIPEVGSVTVGQDGELHVDADAAHLGRIGRELVLAGVTVTELRQTRSSLEDLFMELTGNNSEHPAEADHT